MDDILLSAIRIIEGIDGALDNFGPTYLFTTENISGFSEKISFFGKCVFGDNMCGYCCSFMYIF